MAIARALTTGLDGTSATPLGTLNKWHSSSMTQTPLAVRRVPEGDAKTQRQVDGARSPPAGKPPRRHLPEGGHQRHNGVREQLSALVRPRAHAAEHRAAALVEVHYEAQPVGRVLRKVVHILDPGRVVATRGPW